MLSLGLYTSHSKDYMPFEPKLPSAIGNLWDLPSIFIVKKRKKEEKNHLPLESKN
jgi:hypothetical protein